MRTLAITAVFVLLNAVGFMAYRSVRAADRSAETTTTTTTSVPARPPEVGPVEQRLVIEPVPEPERTAVPVTEPAPAGPSQPPPPAAAVAREDVPHPPRRPTVKPVAEGRKRPSSRGVEVRSRPQPVSAPPAARVPERSNDSLLEMEANPYKRGE